MIRVICFLVTVIPMAIFTAASVLSVVHGHPYFGGAFLVMTLLVIPEWHIGLDGETKKTKENE